MLQRHNAERLSGFATASTWADWARLPPVFLIMDLIWNCNYDCEGCIDTKARSGADAVRKRQAPDPLRPDAALFQGPRLSRPMIEGVVRFARKFGLRGLQMLGGESLLHPDIDWVLATLAREQLPVELVTNGSLIADHVDALLGILAVRGTTLRVSVNDWGGYGRRVGWPDRGEALRERVLEGLRQVLARCSDEMKRRVYVSTVTFGSAVQELPHIVRNLADAGVALVRLIPERDPQMREMVAGREDVGARVQRAIDDLRRDPAAARVEIAVAHAILEDPAPQPKPYRPCPTVMLKTLLGADGRIYSCGNHRGCDYAYFADLHDYGCDLEKAWQSEERVRRALAYAPAAHCRTLVCPRHQSNLVISAMRDSLDEWVF
jgi:MoaA/NifB/PqqE/SkfB family radical SAM enzyme